MSSEFEKQDWKSSTVDLHDDETLLTPAELAAMLRVPISWVYAQTRGRSKAGLPFVKMGRYVRFDRVAVREFIASNAKSRR